MKVFFIQHEIFICYYLLLFVFLTYFAKIKKEKLLYLLTYLVNLFLIINKTRREEEEDEEKD